MSRSPKMRRATGSVLRNSSLASSKRSAKDLPRSCWHLGGSLYFLRRRALKSNVYVPFHLLPLGPSKLFIRERKIPQSQAIPLLFRQGAAAPSPRPLARTTRPSWCPTSCKPTSQVGSSSWPRISSPSGRPRLRLCQHTHPSAHNTTPW